VVLARELTWKELEQVVKKSDIETEVFVHGALCYSFSGMCLFSSYLGGRGANRGLCAQPCRREYQTANHGKYLFNLKDNQLLELIPQLARIGVASLKVEGRMKRGNIPFRLELLTVWFWTLKIKWSRPANCCRWIWAGQKPVILPERRGECSGARSRNRHFNREN
jgi:hypothetical protein